MWKCSETVFCSLCSERMAASLGLWKPVSKGTNRKPVGLPLLCESHLAQGSMGAALFVMSVETDAIQMP